MNKKILFLIILVLILLLLVYLWFCVLMPRYAEPMLSIDYEFDQAASGLGAGPRVVGVRLRIEDDIQIIHLGAYDSGVVNEEGNGFNVAHEVGVFLPDGTLLGSVSIPTGTATPIDGETVNYDLVTSNSKRYRYVALATPIKLEAGQEIVIAASNYGGPLDSPSNAFDTYPIGVVNLMLGNDISFVEGRSTGVGVVSLDFPSVVEDELHLFGGSFIYKKGSCPFSFSF